MVSTPTGESRDQPNRRVPVARRIIAELDQAPNVPFDPALMGFLTYPGPRVGLPEGRTYIELARAVYETAEPTAPNLKAVQRAGERLARAGRIDSERRGSGVVLRRWPTEADHECRAEVERRAREWRQARAEAEAQALDYPIDTGSGVEMVPVEPVLVIGGDGVRLRQPGRAAPGLAALLRRRTA